MPLPPHDARTDARWTNGLGSFRSTGPIHMDPPYREVSLAEAMEALSSSVRFHFAAAPLPGPGPDGLVTVEGQFGWPYRKFTVTATAAEMAAWQAEARAHPDDAANRG